jgi:DNA polymerase III delta prime subunit
MKIRFYIYILLFNESAEEETKVLDVPVEDSGFLGFLLGYEDIVSQFSRAFQQDRLPHTWLFLGEDGLGKATLCYALACSVLGYEGSLGFDENNTLKTSSLYRQIINGAYPELHVFNAPVTLEHVRSIRKWLSQSAFFSSWKVVILPRLDLLRHECVNALLKIVEDPPEKSLFLFTAVSSDFPATLLSRCCTYTLRPSNEQVFFEHLPILLKQLSISAKIDDDLKCWLYQFSRGNLGKAVRVLSTGQVELIQSTWNFLNTSFEHGPRLFPSDLAGNLYRKIDLFQEIIFLWAFDKLSQCCQYRKEFLILDHLIQSIQIWFQQARDFHMDSEFLVQKIISNVALIPHKMAA